MGLHMKSTIIKHLLTRNYDPTRYVNHVIDDHSDTLTVYLNNLSGQFVGYQRYNPNVTDKKTNHSEYGRYYTHCQRGITAVWGLEVLDTSKPDLFVVEGIFKASALHMIGKNAIAVLTSNPKSMKSWLHTLPYRLIGIGDNDKAGKSIPKIAGRGFQSDRDLDEYTLEELEELIRVKVQSM